MFKMGNFWKREEKQWREGSCGKRCVHDEILRLFFRQFFPPISLQTNSERAERDVMYIFGDNVFIAMKINIFTWS